MFKLPKTNVKVFVANVNEDVKKDAIKIAQKLRKNGISCQVDLMNRKISKQFEFANNLAIPFTLTVGPKEVKKNKFKFKNMKTGQEQELSLKKIIKKMTTEKQ
jgi:histidyl-tRNA synthetase